MSYYHDLFQQFDGHQVSVAFLESANWRHLAFVEVREFPSLSAAIGYIVDQQWELETLVVTARSTAETVDFSPVEVTSLVALVRSLHNCQD